MRMRAAYPNYVWIQLHVRAHVTCHQGSMQIALGLYYPYGDILAFYGNDRVRTDAFVAMRAQQHKGPLDLT